MKFTAKWKLMTGKRKKWVDRRWSLAHLCQLISPVWTWSLGAPMDHLRMCAPVATEERSGVHSGRRTTSTSTSTTRTRTRRTLTEMNLQRRRHVRLRGHHIRRPTHFCLDNSPQKSLNQASISYRWPDARIGALSTMPTNADVPSPGSASALRRLLFLLHCNIVGRPLLHRCH